MYTDYDKSVLRVFSENFSNNFRDEDPDQLNQIDTTFQGYQDDDDLFNESEQLDEGLRPEDEGPNAKRYDKYGIRQVWNDVKSDGDVDFETFAKRFKERLKAIGSRKLIPFSQGTLDGCLSVWKGNNRLREIPAGSQSCTLAGFVNGKDGWRFIYGKYGGSVATAFIAKENDKKLDVEAVIDQFIKGLNIDARDGIHYTKNSTSLHLVIAEAGSKYRNELLTIGKEFLKALNTGDVRQATIFKDLTIGDKVHNFFAKHKKKVVIKTVELKSFKDAAKDGLVGGEDALRNCFDSDDLTYIPTNSEVDGAKIVEKALKWKYVIEALEDQGKKLPENFRDGIESAVEKQEQEAEEKAKVAAKASEKNRNTVNSRSEDNESDDSESEDNESDDDSESEDNESDDVNDSEDNESDDGDEDKFAKGLSKLANELQAAEDNYNEKKRSDKTTQGVIRAAYDKFKEKVVAIKDFFTSFRKKGYSDDDFIENFSIDEKSLVDFGFDKNANLTNLNSTERNDLALLTAAYKIGEEATGLNLIKFKNKTQNIVDEVNDKKPEELQKLLENPEEAEQTEIDKSDVKDAVADAAKPLALPTGEQKKLTTLVLERMEGLDIQDDSSVKDVVKTLYKDIKDDIKSLEAKDRVELLNGILQSLNLSDSAEVRLKNGRLTITSNSDSPLVTKDEIRKRVGTALHVLKLGDAAPIENALKDFNTGKETRTQDEIEQAFKTAGLAESIRGISRSLKESHSDDMVALMRFDLLGESVFMDEDLCIDSQAGTAELIDLLTRDVLPVWAGIDTIEKARNVLETSSDPNATEYLEMLNTAETNAKFVDDVLAGL